MSAYTYVTKVKQAEMESGTQSPLGESTTTSVAVPSGKRRSKRQAVPPECVQASTGTSQGVPTGASSSQRYIVYNCSDGTGFIDFTSCDTITVRSPRLPSTTILNNAETTKDVYYSCFHRVCSEDCGIYTDGINAMITQRGCIEGADTTAIGLAAQTVATYCNYADKDCNMGAVVKPANTYGGWCFSETCGYGLTMSCDDCSSGQLTYTHDVDPSCDTTTYISDMIPEVTRAIADSDCGASCTPSPCAFDSADPCKGLNYNRWLCAISMCNASTTSWFTSTTTAAETTTTLLTTAVAETSTTLISTTPYVTSSSTLPETTTAGIHDDHHHHGPYKQYHRDADDDG
ncbi:hypothetical protein AAVH_08465 [Aphelenchoides avenae]|nr:hypothetical protein AAVH_08465 [Aphelenchus avenae]